jgi:hypothetical protein
VVAKPNTVAQFRETVQNILRSMESTIWNRNHSIAAAVMAK